MAGITLRRSKMAKRKIKSSSLTEMALQALTEAVAKVIEDHHRRGIPLAVWRNGKAVTIPAAEAAPRLTHDSFREP
jgi:fumarate hydratase class II